MTTQAQIEAREADQLREILKDRENEITKLKAALTAAAGGTETSTPSEIIEAKWRGWFDEAIIDDRNATIERCAQRLEDFLINSEGKIRDADDLEDYVAAIRALKDKPRSPAGDHGQVGWMGGEGP